MLYLLVSCYVVLYYFGKIYFYVIIYVTSRMVPRILDIIICLDGNLNWLWDIAINSLYRHDNEIHLCNVHFPQSNLISGLECLWSLFPCAVSLNCNVFSFTILEILQLTPIRSYSCNLSMWIALAEPFLFCRRSLKSH